MCSANRMRMGLLANTLILQWINHIAKNEYGSVLNEGSIQKELQTHRPQSE